MLDESSGVRCESVFAPLHLETQVGGDGIDFRDEVCAIKERTVSGVLLLAHVDGKK